MDEEAKKPDVPDAAATAAPEPGKLEEGSGKAEDLDLSTAKDLHSFCMKKKTTRHYVAHEEYGVLFSHCGIRIRRVDVAYDPPPKGAYELICMKCLEHTKRLKAAAMGKDPALT